MNHPLRVLIVEDSEVDAALLVHELRRGGYDPMFERVDTSTTMKAALDRQEWDIVFADYSMPHLSGTAALTLLKERGLDVPFIFVSGSIGEDIAVDAMKAGAHDYIMKGNLKRLVPAVERELREAELRRERKQAGEALWDSEGRFRAVIETANDAIVSADSSGNITYFNKAAERLFGYPSSDVIGEPLTLLMPGRFHDSHRQGLARFLDTGEAHVIGKTVELAGLRKDGTEFPLELSIASWKTREGTFFTGILRDITERKWAEATIRHLAYYDPLTGLPNRALLHDRLQQAILTGQRESKPVAFLLMDLDRFKEINDTLGHHRGDLLLQQLGKCIREILRESDTVARPGGDEFAILLPNTDTQGATLTTRKILKTLEAPFVIEDLPIAVEASIGIVLYPDHGTNAGTLIQRVDVAMYIAKQTGSGYTVYAPEQDRHSPRRLALMGELRHAIEHDQLFLHYQPKIHLQTSRVMGVEALVRWQHPQYGLIPPDQFIAPAERTGLIKPLTRWVLQAALRQCQEWHQAGFLMTMAVNLSARNLQDPELPDQVTGLLSASGVAPRLLELEITESAIMADPARAMETVTYLNQMGIWLSIDDFGTGYSSMGYLKKLMVNTIKIDKSFVIGMAVDKDDAVIVQSIINLAHNLGLKVVAEGVEGRETWDRLVALGCDAAQGYHVSRPLPADETTRWLSESPYGLKTI